MKLETGTFQDEGYNALTVMHSKKTEPLRQCVLDAMQRYFNHLDGHGATNLYRLVMNEVEAPLLESVMQHTGGNQTRAATLLGISRSTLRKKTFPIRHGLNLPAACIQRDHGQVRTSTERRFTRPIGIRRTTQ